MPELFKLLFLWKSKIYLYTSRITLPVYVRLTLFLKHRLGILAHDRPEMDCQQVNHNSSVIHLSSFQAFVVIFTTVWNSKYEIYPQEFDKSLD